MPLMRSRMTLSVYRHSGGSGLRPKPAGFLVPPPPAQGVNTPTRSTGHHIRVNSRQHILKDISRCVQGRCNAIYTNVYFLCLQCTPTRGQHFSKVNMRAGGRSDPWFLVCVPTCLFLSLLLVLLVIVRIVEDCWICCYE